MVIFCGDEATDFTILGS